ncbi:ABC-ATPase domain-containing protein [Dethiothermospora halolimnae]|uniref:ABC-ATPase domain-containing protein n=1 Tax=Dethiothermospora halolimnae TaxID=3114390 RepID=UPI003CCC316F
MKHLQERLRQIDKRGYKAYKSIQGTYKDRDFTLHIDYVQPDPFANPSRIRVEVPKKVAQYNKEWYDSPHRKIAFEDFITREISKEIKKEKKGRRGSGKSGLILIDSPGQEILNRTSAKVDDNKIEIRLSLGLPAKGRRIISSEAIKMLCTNIPNIVRSGVLKFNKDDLIKQLKLIDQQHAIREFLKENDYVSFIANNSILPRKSGISNRPLEGNNVIPFISPKSLEIEIPIPHSEPIKGMAIPKGVSLIVGGGYNGKSTVLKAIERGIYNHILGDGREYVITESSAFKIRAEDGRRVEKVNISPFISKLPFGKDTERFSSEDASGSTSQAANIMEALEVQSKLLLIDEDTSATNFMIRDGRMQELVAKDKEPITPFIDKVRQLYEDYGVSTILVIGGSGDYFDVADNIIMMDEYKPIDVTEKAKSISERLDNKRIKEGGGSFGDLSNRILSKHSFKPFKGRKKKVANKGLHTIIYGRDSIELSFVEQVIDSSQTNAIAYMIDYIASNLNDERTPINALIDKLYSEIDKNGLDVVSPYYGQHPGNLALPRKQELASAINRLRSLKVK